LFSTIAKSIQRRAGRPLERSSHPRISNRGLRFRFNVGQQRRPLADETLLLCALFGALYFTQGLASRPRTGRAADALAAQVVGRNQRTDHEFCAWITLPWLFKPLYGLMADFLPLGRNRRKNYLILNDCGGLPRVSRSLFLSARPECRTLAFFGRCFCRPSRWRLPTWWFRRPDDRGRPTAWHHRSFAVDSNGPRFGLPQS